MIPEGEFDVIQDKVESLKVLESVALRDRISELEKILNSIKIV